MTDTRSHLTTAPPTPPSHPFSVPLLFPTATASSASSVRAAWPPSTSREDLKHDRKVAIKVLRPELSAVIGAERFLREIKTIATLQHPHILGLIDSAAR